MGYDSTLILAVAYGKGEDGLVSSSDVITVSMPRWGWQWASDVKDLQVPGTAYSTYYHGERVTRDAYDMPILALNPRRLLKYIEREGHEGVQVKAVKVICKSILKDDWDGTARILFYGH